MASAEQIRVIQKDISDIRVEVGKGEQAHTYLKEKLEEHIEDTNDKLDEIGAQVNALANALLTEQAREEVEEEYKKRQRQNKTRWDEKRVLWYTTIVIALSAMIGNASDILKWIGKLFTTLAG